MDNMIDKWISLSLGDGDELRFGIKDGQVAIAVVGAFVGGRKFRSILSVATSNQLRAAEKAIRVLKTLKSGIVAGGVKYPLGPFWGGADGGALPQADVKIE
jgi:hypothetical protein